MHLTWESFELSLGMSWFESVQTVRPTRRQPCMQFGRVTVSNHRNQSSKFSSTSAGPQQCPRFMSSTTALLYLLLQRFTGEVSSLTASDGTTCS
jgi:hypothetical protein